MKNRKKTFWTDEKVTYLLDNICKIGYEAMSKFFNKSVQAIKTQLKRLKFRVKKSYYKHDYISQIDLMKTIKEKGFYMTYDILRMWEKIKLIKRIKLTKNKSVVTNILYSENDFNWIMNFLEHYVCLNVVKEQLKEVLTVKSLNNIFRKRKNSTDNFDLVRFTKTNLIWLSKKDFERILNIKNAYSSKELGNIVGYSNIYLSELRKKGIVTKYFKLFNKYWYYKDSVIEIKKWIKANS